MFAQHCRSALFAVLLTSTLVAPAWSAETDAAKTAGTQQVVAMSPAAPPEAGPVIVRGSLATKASDRATVVVGENQPTRGFGSPTVGKPYGGARGGYDRPAHRHGLMLGIGY